MPEAIFPVRFPKPQQVDVVLIKLPDGTIVARTTEELAKAKQPKKEGGEG